MINYNYEVIKSNEIVQTIILLISKKGKKTSITTVCTFLSEIDFCSPR